DRSTCVDWEKLLSSSILFSSSSMGPSKSRPLRTFTCAISPFLSLMLTLRGPLEHGPQASFLVQRIFWSSRVSFLGTLPRGPSRCSHVCSHVPRNSSVHSIDRSSPLMGSLFLYETQTYIKNVQEE